MHKFGKRSQECKATLHEDWQVIHDTAIKTIPVDYGIHQGEEPMLCNWNIF